MESALIEAAAAAAASKAAEAAASITATAIAEEVFPVDLIRFFPRGRLRLVAAVFLLTVLILFYLLRNVCNWCRHTPPHVLSSWDRFSVGLYENDNREERHRRHSEAVRHAWSLWATLRNRISRNEVSTTWQEWSSFGNRIRNHHWHLARRGFGPVDLGSRRRRDHLGGYSPHQITTGAW